MTIARTDVVKSIAWAPRAQAGSVPVLPTGTMRSLTMPQAMSR